MRPWKAPGRKRRAIESDAGFAVFVTRLALDFMLLHELAHVVRGHVDRYLRLRPSGMAKTGGARWKPHRAVARAVGSDLASSASMPARSGPPCSPLRGSTAC